MCATILVEECMCAKQSDRARRVLLPDFISRWFPINFARSESSERNINNRAFMARSALKSLSVLVCSWGAPAALFRLKIQLTMHLEFWRFWVTFFGTRHFHWANDWPVGKQATHLNLNGVKELFSVAIFILQLGPTCNIDDHSADEISGRKKATRASPT